MAPAAHGSDNKNDAASTRPVAARPSAIPAAAPRDSAPRTTPCPSTGGEVMTPLGAFRIGSVPLLRGTDDCPGCGSPKVRPRPAFPGVKWCFDCGRQFDGSTLEEIDPVRGPAALANDREIIPPFDAATRESQAEVKNAAHNSEGAR
jgi:hypothetical protein